MKQPFIKSIFHEISYQRQDFQQLMEINFSRCRGGVSPPSGAETAMRFMIEATGDVLQHVLPLRSVSECKIHLNGLFESPILAFSHKPTQEFE